MINNFPTDENGAYIIDHAELFENIQALVQDYPMLLDMTAVDYLHLENMPTRFALIYIFRSADFKSTLTLKSFIPDDDLHVRSISELYKAANWAEREVYDQYGIVFDHHPCLKRILNHQEFVGHPLRKDYPITQGQWCEKSDDLLDEMSLKLKQKGYDNHDDIMFLNIGPAHPASHGTIRTLMALDGESIVAGVSEIGYLHRGFEKSCENHTYNQIIPYTDRLNYCSAILNNIGYAKAIEDMLGVELPLRAQYIRVITGELSRIIDHIVCLAALFVDMGALTNYWYLFNAREVAYKLLSKLTGARLTNSYMRVGGMTHDLYDGFDEDLKEVLKAVELGMKDALKLVEHNRIFLDRTQNIGIMNAKDALSFGFTGPNLRASGVAYDIRKTNPYYIYDQLDFEIPLGSVGDVYDRIMVRFEEIRQSICIINQAMKTLPDGAIKIDNLDIVLPEKKAVYNSIEGLMNQFKLIIDGVKVPAMERYSATEAGNGELGFFVVSDGSGTPYKIKLRPPCFYSMGAYTHLCEGNMLSDAILSLGSINIIAGELDR